MQLANEVQNFCGSSERLLSLMAMNRPLTEEEATLIEYYCQELSDKVASRQPNPQP